MKTLVVLSFILVAGTCTNNSSAVSGNDTATATSSPSANATIAGRWVLVPVLSSDTAGGKLLFLNFSLTDKRFSGNNGCNSISGTFELKGDEIRFDEQIISTKMACSGYNEKVFMDNLLKVNRFEIKDSTLNLMYNTTPLSKWTRHADTSSVKTI